MHLPTEDWGSPHHTPESPWQQDPAKLGTGLGEAQDWPELPGSSLASTRQSTWAEPAPFPSWVPTSCLLSPHQGQGTRNDSQLGQEDAAWLWPMGLPEPQSAQLGVELLTGAQGCLGQGWHTRSLCTAPEG